MKSATHESQKKSIILNCWEFKKCGREDGCSHVADIGVCPASIEKELDDVHRGKMPGGPAGLLQGLCAREWYKKRLRRS